MIKAKEKGYKAFLSRTQLRRVQAPSPVVTGARTRAQKSLIALFFCLLLATPAQAISESTLDRFEQNGIYYYDPEGNQNNNCFRGAGSTNVSGSEIKEKIWNGLISVGFTQEQTAGIMGNMGNESGFSPARHETTFYNEQQNGANIDITTDIDVSYGLGLIQWSFGRRVNMINAVRSYDSALLRYLVDDWETYGHLGGDAFFQAAPASVVDGLLAAQLQFLHQEIENSYSGFLDQTTVYDAAKYFLERVEVPQNPYIEYHPGRATDAQAFYDIYAGSSSQPGSTSPAIANNVIYIGDSRTVGLCTTLNLDNCISEVGMGYNWFISTAKAQAQATLDNNPDKSYTIVISLGINDLANVEKYKQEYQRLSSGQWSRHKIIITAVAPIDASLATQNGYNVTSSSIDTFNNTMRSITLENGSFCAATSNIAYDGPDGIHYSSNGNRAIYNAITKDCSVTPSSPTGVNCVVGTASEYTSDGLQIFLQGDPQWGNKPYGSCGDGSTIASSGCGPSAMAMIITAMTGRTVTPDILAEKAVSRGYRACGSGSYHTIAFLARDYGLTVSGSPIDISNIANVNQILSSGGMILISGSGGEPFTTGGHFIAIRGVTESGKWKIFDSKRNGKETSAKEWNPSVLIGGNDWGGYAITK